MPRKWNICCTKPNVDNKTKYLTWNFFWLTYPSTTCYEIQSLIFKPYYPYSHKICAVTVSQDKHLYNIPSEWRRYHALPIHTDSEQFSVINTSICKPLFLAKRKLIAPSQHPLMCFLNVKPDGYNKVVNICKSLSSTKKKRIIFAFPTPFILHTNPL